MQNTYQGNADTVKEKLAAEHVKYGISIGRRAPMHRMHVDCIKEISDAGLTPIILMGSTNGPQSPYYDPLRNPMTVAQQKIQLKKSIPSLKVDQQVITLEDFGEEKKWCDALSAKISRSGLAGKSVAHLRTKSVDANVAGPIRQLSSYKMGMVERGLPVWESVNRNKADDNINASDLRTLDLEHLTSEQRQTFSAPDYIIQIAKDARAHNPSRAELDAAHIPVTVLDLTFDRLRHEADIETASIITAAKAKGDVTLTSLTKATEKAIRTLHEHSKPKTAREEETIKVASVSLNQTVLDFTRNVPNIMKAVDKAIEDKADVLAMQELVLTGYTGDDNFKWIHAERQQKEMLELLQHIAEHANKKDPNLVISVGFPLFYADKHQPVKLNVGTAEHPVRVDNPLYNMNNKPFNAVAILSHGKIQAISAKSILPEGAAEYEGRQFQSWPDYLGAKEITLATGEKVPFGKVVVDLQRNDGKKISVYHEICAEAWPGIADDGTINVKEMHQARYLKQLVNTHDISLIINPSASKPEPFLDKPELRKSLCTTGSAIAHGAGYVYTNCSGLEAAPVAFESGSIFASKGEIVHTGERYHMGDIIYSSAVMQVPLAEKGVGHAVVPHQFTAHEERKVGGSATWEAHAGETRVHEEIMRNTALWMRDYLKKSGQQGFFISLSGGQDSAFGAVAITQMIDLNIHQLEQSLGSKAKAVDAFVDQFDGLKYANDVKQVTREKGAEAGVDFLKSKMLTCAYFPSENSSRDTRDAARFLIEGGTTVEIETGDAKNPARPVLFNPAHDRIEGDTLFYKSDDGKIHEYTIVKQHEAVKGIGGTFHVMPVQDIIDSYMEVFSGIDKKGLAPEQVNKLREEVKQVVKGDREAVSDEFKDRVKRRIPSWKNKGDDLTLQNIQARARLPVAWLFGNDENKIACVTSNWSEAVAGYWTFGGDGHMGSINVLGGIPKSTVRRTLPYLEKHGLGGLETVPSLSLINGNKASAELRPLKDGKIAQYDENDMMPYEVLDAIAHKIFNDKQIPFEAYKQLWDEQPKFPDSDIPLFTAKEQLIADIEQCCWRWDASQFKRVASVITPFMGDNVDPHTAIRTTIMSNLFRNGRAEMKLEYLKDTLGGDQAFQEVTGKSFRDAIITVKTNKALLQAVLKSPLDGLENVLKEHQRSQEHPNTAVG